MKIISSEWKVSFCSSPPLNYCFFLVGGALSTQKKSVGTRYDGELREPLVWCQGSQGFMSVAEGAHHCPRVMVGESGPNFHYFLRSEKVIFIYVKYHSI